MEKKTVGWCLVVIGVLVVLFLSIPIGGGLIGVGIASLLKAGK